MIPGADIFAQALGLIQRSNDSRKFVLDMLPKCSIGMEIGVHKGDFSQDILMIVFPKELHLVDPWKHETSAAYKDAWYGGQVKNGQVEMDERYMNVCSKFTQEVRSGQVSIHRGFSTEILSQFPDEYFDWVYIDGNHYYEYVKRDIELSFRKTKIGGFITGDDYTDEGWWEGGVKKAVDQFATHSSVHLVEIRNGQFIIQKKSSSS